MTRVQIDYPERTIHTREIPVRISDINYGNHVGHDTFVSIMHEARAGFFRAHRMDEADIDGVGTILVDLAVSYRSQSFYGDLLRVEIAFGDVTSRGCDLLYRVTNAETGKALVLGRTGILFYDYEREKVVNIPPRFRALIDDSTRNFS